MKFQKGFIEAIGDDLPSLIPIIVGLLIFFSVFSITLATYDRENTKLWRDITMLSVAKSLKGDSLILSHSQFVDRCNQVTMSKYPYNFMAAVYYADYETSSVVKDFQETQIGGPYSEHFLENIDNPSEKYFCGYKKIGSKDFGLEFFGGRESRREFFLKYYPVAVQVKLDIGGKEHYVIAPGIMAVVVWQ